MVKTRRFRSEDTDVKLRLLVPAILLAILCAWKFAEADGALDCPWPAKCDPTDIHETGVPPRDASGFFSQVMWVLRSNAPDMVAPNNNRGLNLIVYADPTSNGLSHDTKWPPDDVKAGIEKTDIGAMQVKFWRGVISQSAGGGATLQAHHASPGDGVALGLDNRHWAPTPTSGDEGSLSTRIATGDIVPFMPIGELSSNLSVDDSSIDVSFASRLWWKYIGQWNFIVFMDASNEYELTDTGDDGISSVVFGAAGGSQLVSGGGAVWTVAQSGDLPTDLDRDTESDWYTQYCFALDNSTYKTNVSSTPDTAVFDWLPIIRGPGDEDCDADGSHEGAGDVCAADEFTTGYWNQGNIYGAPEGWGEKNEFTESNWAPQDGTIRPCTQIETYTVNFDSDGEPVSTDGPITLRVDSKHAQTAGSTSSFQVHSGGPPGQGWGFSVNSSQRRGRLGLMKLAVGAADGDQQRIEQAMFITGRGHLLTNNSLTFNEAIRVTEANSGFVFKHFDTKAESQVALDVPTISNDWNTNDGDLYQVVRIYSGNNNGKLYYDSQDETDAPASWRISTNTTASGNTDAQVVPGAPYTSVKGDMMVWIANPNTDTGREVCDQWYLACSDVLDSGFDSTTENCTTASATDAIALCRGHAQ